MDKGKGKRDADETVERKHTTDDAEFIEDLDVQDDEDDEVKGGAYSYAGYQATRPGPGGYSGASR